jgi:hypothetical protein
LRPVVWILERAAFRDAHESTRDAVLAAGHRAEEWRDEWWSEGRWPRFEDAAVVFHGSLGNAHRIHEQLPWRPGAYCDTAAFHCSAWYPRAAEWLLHREWRVVRASDLVETPSSVLDELGRPSSLFVRPDSPLKPFGGRVLSSSSISLKALDHGLYYEDSTIPVVVAPVRSIAREWRYVVVGREVVTGCVYAPVRSRVSRDDDEPSWRFAADVAARMVPPEDVYVMDVCEADGELRLLELNPFGGADLYACAIDAVVATVAERAQGHGKFG